VYDELAATMNARLSSMLQYILCVSRFAHYLKVLARDKVGSFLTPEECEDYLNKWLRNYVMGKDDAGPEVKARYPLREGKIKVREIPGKPGSYRSEIHLRPHYQLDQMVGSVRLMTELNQARQV
jgi:type VI secretion system ImpC/EvpB family protein